MQPHLRRDAGLEHSVMNNNRKITLGASKNIILEFTDERIIPASGLAVAGALLGKSDFAKKLNRMDVTKNRSQHQIKNGDIILAYIGMLCMGKPYFEAVHEMNDDKAFYQTALADGLVPADIDVTPMDNSKSAKEAVSLTYKGFDRYAPMMAYIGTEDYAIIGLYHAHREIKADMDLKRLPSGKFETNALILELGPIALQHTRDDRPGDHQRPCATAETGS